MINNKIKVAFDVDDTLVIPSVVSNSGVNEPNLDMVAICSWMIDQGLDVIIWSGSGIEWAEKWREKLVGNKARVVEKGSERVDICFDDCSVDLADKNIKVRRMKNGVSRA